MAVAAAKAPPIKFQARPPAALPKQLTDQGIKGRWHRLTPTVAIPASALMAPNYWANIASKLTPGDLIEVYPEGANYDLLLRVTAVGKNWAQVRVLWAFPADCGVTRAEESGSADIQDDLQVEWAGGTEKWRVLRVSDKEVVAANFDSRTQAEDWVSKRPKK